MKGIYKKISAFALIALLTLGSSFSAFAATVTPTFNYSSHDPYLIGYSTLKIDPPNNGNYNSGSLTVVIFITMKAALQATWHLGHQTTTVENRLQLAM